MKIGASNVFKSKKGIYIPHSGINGLFFCSNIETEKIEAIGQFPNPSNDNAWNIISTIQHNDEIYFFSRFAFEAWRLVDENQFEKIEYGDNTKRVALKAIIKYKNCAWVFPPYFSQNIIKVDLNTWESEIIKWDAEKYSAMDKQSFSELIIHKNKIYFTNRIPNNIGLFEMDLDTLELRCIILEDFNCAHSILPEDKTFWVLGRKKEGIIALVQYSYSGELIKELVLENQIQLIEENDTRIIYPYIININNKIIIPPYLGIVTIIADIVSGEVSCLKSKTITGIYSYYLDAEKLFLFSENRPWMVVLDSNLSVYNKRNLEVVDKKKISILSNAILKESECIKLDDLITELISLD